MLNLRGLLAEAESMGELKAITQPIDWDEEMGALNYMVAQREDSPVLWFQNIRDARYGSTAVFNLFGMGKDRIALSLGLPQRPPAHETWFRNVRAMHALCTEFGIPYVQVLQPILGFGRYHPTAAEDQMLRKVDGVWGGFYTKMISDFYPKATQECKKLKYCLDLTDLFENRTGVFLDPRHVIPEGHQIEAEAIFAHLKKTGTFQPRPQRLSER